MPKLLIVSFSLCCLLFSNSVVRSQDSDLDWNTLENQLIETTKESESIFRQLQYVLDAAKSARFNKDFKAADRLYRAAEELGQKDSTLGSQFLLIDYAIETNQLELTGVLAKRAKLDDVTFLDRLAIAQYRHGDDSALDDFPHAPLDLQRALELASAMIDRGEYERASEFVLGVKITEENDPKDVAGIAFEKIALKCFDEGNKEGARVWIDQAYEIAGTQYYTGMSITNWHLAIHDQLAEKFELQAKRAVAYRGHMARELLLGLIDCLVRNDQLENAEKVIPKLTEASNRDLARQKVVLRIANSGRIDEARKLVDSLETEDGKAMLTIQIAEVIRKQGDLAKAAELISAMQERMEADPTQQSTRMRATLIQLCTLLDQSSAVKTVIDDERLSANDRSQLIAAALRGLAGIDL